MSFIIRGLLQSSIGCDMDRTPETYACHLFYNHHSEEVQVPHTRLTCCGGLDENVAHKLMCVNTRETGIVNLELSTFETVRIQRQAPKTCSSLGGVDRVLKARNKDTQGRWRSRGLHRF